MKTIGVAVLAAAAVFAGAAQAENPTLHQRRPETYQAPPPLPLPSVPQVPAVAAPKPRSGDVLEHENEEKRTGLRPLRQKPLDPNAKPEMVGESKLWSTRDDPRERGVFAFLGNRIGDGINAIFPDPTEKDTFGMPLCRTTIGIPGFLDCADDSIKELINGAWVMLYRGVEVSYLNYRYLNQKLVGFQMGFPTNNFEKLGDAMEKQYGAPHDKEEFLWRVRPGYELRVKTWTWNTPHGAMVLKSRAEATEAGMVSLIEPKAEETYNALRYKLMVSRGFSIPKATRVTPDDENADDRTDAQDKAAAQKKSFDLDNPETRKKPDDESSKRDANPAAVKRLQAE